VPGSSLSSRAMATLVDDEEFLVLDLIVANEEGNITRNRIGCGGLEPSELFSAPLQVGTNPARGVACKVISWRLLPSSGTAGRCKWRQKLFRNEMLTRTWLGS